MDITAALGWALIFLMPYYGGALDVLLITSFAAHKDWANVQELYTSYVNPTVIIQTAEILIAVFVLIQILRYTLSLSRHPSIVVSHEFPVKPLLFPCRTDHARMIPTKHTFSYSYLFVGVPVGWRGNSGGMISCEDEREPWYLSILSSLSFGLGGKGAWWSVNGDHYLGRGHDEDGLQGKLRAFLETQGVDPNQYSFAYLLTAARFLNYASNPVSIWHLYSADKQLQALVLEVNNTFDERRNYFLEPARNVTNSKAVRYTGTWPKDFYVSTFNSRSGAYSLTAIDPLASLLHTSPSKLITKPIDSTITLSNADASRAMLIARVFSVSAPLDPSTMSIFHKTHFLLSWWWVGFATFPRTVVQAATLLFKKKMPWVFTPQPRKDTMPKHASETEILIEWLFRAYLRSVVHSSPAPLRVRYVPAGIVGGTEEVMTSARALKAESNNDFDNDEIREHELHILTPLFYTRITQYSSIYSALMSEHTDSATILLSSPSFLSSLDFSPLSTEAVGSMIDNALFTLLASLKKTPAIIPPLADETPLLSAEKFSLSLSPKKGKVEEMDPAEANKRTPKGLSGLDVFVLAFGPRVEKREYVLRVLKMVFAEHVGFGWMEILDLEILAVKTVIAWGAVKLIF